MMSYRLNKFLAMLSAVAAVVLFATSGEPVVSFLRGTVLEAFLQSLGHPNSIAFNLSVGYLVSTFFWLLVVYFPARSHRNLIRENLRRSYQQFKESVIQILLWASIGTHGSEMPKELCDQKKFKSFFHADKQKHWYAALNGLQEEPDRMHELVLELEIFADEVGYVLNTVDIQDAKVHQFFKLLKQHIYRLNHSNIYTYDQAKYVGQFLWEVLALWSPVEGYEDKDIIQETINRL
jgi:hypothetical protein